MIRTNPGTIGEIRKKVACEFSNFENSSKIARVAPILTIFGRNRSRRPELKFEKRIRAVVAVVVGVVVVGRRRRRRRFCSRRFAAPRSKLGRLLLATP